MSPPTRPGDVPHSAALGVVAYRYSHHVLTLTEHRRVLDALPPSGW